MDNTATLKRRRPHFYDDEPLDLCYQTGSSFSADASSSFSPQQQFILQQAASVLGLPPQDMFCLSPQYYNSYILERAADILDSTPQGLIELDVSPRSYQKRLRRTFESPVSNMPQYLPTYSEHDPENASRSTELNTHDHVSDSQQCAFQLPLAENSSFFVSTASGVVDCLASLATCPPSPIQTSTEYEAVLMPASSAAAVALEPRQYTSNRSHASVMGAANLTQANEPYNDGYVAPQVENWLFDDSTVSAQYMQSYPALQPAIMASTSTPIASHLTRVQPSTHSENMYYPDDQLYCLFPKLEDDDTIGSMKGIPTTSLPVQTASLSETPLYGRLAQIPVGVVCNRESPPFVAASHPIIPPLAVANMPFVSTENSSPNQIGVADLGLAEGGLLGLTTPGTVVEPHYTQSVPHQQHHVQNRMPPTAYMNNVNLEISAQPYQRAPTARRGPFKDQTERQKTAQTRKIGSCIRCRMQRIRCNPDEGNSTGECLGCKKSISRTWRLPCLRLKIVDVVLSKTSQVKGHEWTLRWKENTVLDDVGHWASSEDRMVRISEGYTNEYVELRVRRFVPQKGDSLERSWVTPEGETRSVTIPPYAVIEPETISSRYSAYIRKGLIACCVNVLSEHKESLIWPTYWMAVSLSRHTKSSLSDLERTLLSNTLKLWMTVRLTTRSFEIVGDETLDMPKDILDETSPSYGKVPIPPVMGAQLDSVLIHQIQHTLKHVTLERLQKQITDNKARSWFTTYLVTFILLHNAALIIKHDASYARKHGMKRRFAREDKVQEYYKGAITLLAYFHYCNKGVFPFTEEAKDQDVRDLANLDEEALNFVRQTRKVAITHKSHWQMLIDTNAYEDDYYFISQLFAVNWQPRDMVI